MHIGFVFGLSQQPNIALHSQPENKVEHTPWMSSPRANFFNS